MGEPLDIEVEQDPALFRKGRDPQLEKAVKVALEELKEESVSGTPASGVSELQLYHRALEAEP